MTEKFLFILFQILSFFSLIKICFTSINIEINQKTKIEWEGCLLKKFAIYPWDNSPCGQCAISGTELADFTVSGQLPEDYINCTAVCERPTICTKYKYTIDGVNRSECYQCELGKNEVVKYRAIRSYKICQEECKKCAKEADLSTAIFCSFKCNGSPTFCYPTELWFGYHKCYQATTMYGCSFTKITPPDVRGCFECAITADMDDAKQCASECNGIPTYHARNNYTKEVEFFQCQLGPYREVFEHNIPQNINNFLMLETPLIHSKTIQVMKYVPSELIGNYTKQIKQVPHA